MREIQRIAETFRESCKIIKYGIADLFNECDRAEYMLIRYPIGDDGVLGFSQIRDGDRIIFSNSSSRLARELFTVAHELGHLQLHLKNEGYQYLDTNMTFSSCNKDEKEIEANYYAVCLLMPETEIKRYMKLVLNDKPSCEWTAFDIAKMMSAFNVSFDMTLNRLQNLQIISSSKRNQLDSEKNEMKVTKLLSMIGGNSKLNISTRERKIPSKYIDWVVSNYNHQIIPKDTLEKALHYFNLSIEDISDELCTKEENVDDLEELIGGIDD